MREFVTCCALASATCGETAYHAEPGRRQTLALELPAGPFGPLRRDARSKPARNGGYNSMIELALRDALGIEEYLRVTPNHELWSVESKRWLPAQQHKVGQHLVNARGSAVSVVSLHALARREAVYNLEIANSHSYFVGRTQVWAHNTSKRPEPNQDKRRLARVVDLSEYPRVTLEWRIAKTVHAISSESNPSKYAELLEELSLLLEAVHYKDQNPQN